MTRLLLRLFNVPDHVEGLLGKVVPLPLAEFLEALNRFGDRNVLAGTAAEDFGREEGLGEELLNLPGPVHDEFILFGELLHSEDGDNVLKLFIALEDLFDLTGRLVVLLTDDRGVQDPE